MLYQGENLSLKQIDNHCAELCFDARGSSVNLFNHKTVSELSAALDVLEADSRINGLLISSGKKAFIAGADISEFGPAFIQGPDSVSAILAASNSNFNRLEDLPYPVVVAINGFALGGGCELCLACDYRVGTETARIGLPETRLGIIPGWGGTVRLPRIAGIETALEWIAGGKEYRAADALKAGVFDGVVTGDNLSATALTTLQRCIDGSLDYRQRRSQKQVPLQHNAVELTLALTTTKAFIAAQADNHYPAPIAAVNVVEKAAGCNRSEALAIETDTFIELTQTPEALALSGLFISDQFVAKQAKHWIEKSDKPVERAGVLGAGIMGGGIAYQSALKKIPIKMKDIAQAGIDLGLAEASKLLTKRVDRGRMTAADMGAVLNRIEPTLSYDGFGELDIVVEAVVEDPKIKQAVLTDVENQVSADTVIATNTSTIAIDQLAGALQRPEHFCGMHFFNPVHAMPLVEVIRGSQTSDATVARTVAYAQAMGKKAVVVKDCPGFLVNRVLFPYFAGFSLLLRDGADFKQVDKVMERWGWPMGPAYLMDVIGIDTCIHAEKVMAAGFPDRMQRDFKSAVDCLFEAERLGQKTSAGFYDYGVDKKGKPTKHIADATEALLQLHRASEQTLSDGDISDDNISNDDISNDEIVARMMIPMATELSRCLQEGIVATPAEADMALIYGLGFPPFRGGIFRWLDRVGVQAFCTMARQYESLSPLYAITDDIRQRAADNRVYYPL